jgi:hypothetical protein
MQVSAQFSGPKLGTKRLQPETVKKKKARVCGPFLGADEGTRTLDLLHGKQTL